MYMFNKLPPVTFSLCTSAHMIAELKLASAEDFPVGNPETDASFEHSSAKSATMCT